MAPVFTPSLGNVHECSISAAVTIIRIEDFMGRTTGLYLSNSWNVFVFCSSCGIMSESNSSFVKSEHS